MKELCGKNGIWIKTIALAMVCLFLASGTALVYPETGQVAQKVSLARWLVTRSLMEAGAEDPLKAHIEIKTGLDYLATGSWEIPAVNSLLAESAVQSNAEAETEFLSCAQREDGTTTAQVCLARNRDMVFEVSRDEGGEIRIRAPDGLTEHASRPTRVLLVSLRSKRYPAITEALGVMSLAGDLRSHFGKQVDVRVLDMQLQTEMKEIQDTIVREEPDVLGLSLKLGSLEFVNAIIDCVRGLPPSVNKPVIALGGILPSFSAEELLALYPEALIASGEGELTLRKIVEYSQGKCAKSDIPNIAYVSDGQTVRTPRERLPLSEIGLPIRALSKDVEMLHGNAALETSRGCPWNRCAFCSRAEFYRHRWLGYPLERIIADLKELAAHGVRNVFILDDDALGGGLARARELAQAIINAGLAGTINFSIDTSVASFMAGVRDDGNDDEVRETLELLRRAGLHRVFLGVESGSERQLARYDKNISPGASTTIINIIRGMGFHVDVDMVFFDPDVTIEDLKEDIRFVSGNGLVHMLSAPLNRMRAHRGCPYTKKLDKAERLKNFDLDYLLYDYDFTDADVQKVYGRAKAWEEQIFELYYALKGLVRFYWISEANSAIAIAVKDYLDRLKSIDFALLETLVDDPGMSDDSLHAYLDGLRERRYAVFRDVLFDIMSGKFAELEKTAATLKTEIDRALARHADESGSVPYIPLGDSIYDPRTGAMITVLLSEGEIPHQETGWMTYRGKRCACYVQKRENGSLCIIVPSMRADEINRDTAWLLKQELFAPLSSIGATHLLVSALDLAEITMLRRDLPLYDGNALDFVLENSHDAFVRQTRAYAEGRETYDPGQNILGTEHYSHIRHFSSIYAAEIAIMLAGGQKGEISALEIGSSIGSGIFVKQALLGERASFVGIDINTEFLRAAGAFAAKRGIGQASFLQADVTGSGWEHEALLLNGSKKYDYVISSHTLEHLAGKRPEEVIGEWIGLANRAAIVSVPFEDEPSKISEHTMAIRNPQDLCDLAARIEAGNSGSVIADTSCASLGIVVFYRKDAPRSPPLAEYFARKRIEHVERSLYAAGADVKRLAARSVEYLGTTPVNEYIDISAIPGDADQLSQNMKTLARLIAWNNSFGLNIRYVLDNDRNNEARDMLVRELAEGELSHLPGVDSGELVSRIGTPHADNNAIHIYVRAIGAIKTDLADREYEVVLKDDPGTAGIPIPNYAAASAVGLSLAALRAVKDKEGDDGYAYARRKMFDAISGIYTRTGIITDEKEFTLADLDFMVTGCSANRLKYALLYALPPIAKDLAEKIHHYHEMIRRVLQAA